MRTLLILGFGGLMALLTLTTHLFGSPNPEIVTLGAMIAVGLVFLAEKFSGRRHV